MEPYHPRLGPQDKINKAPRQFVIRESAGLDDTYAYLRLAKRFKRPTFKGKLRISILDTSLIAK